MTIDRLQAALRDVPDFPKPGVLFKDITPILNDPELFRLAVDLMTAQWRNRGITKVAAIEARGFIFGAAVALELNAGLVPIRKKGKLPYATIEASYDLEYGSATLAMHVDAIHPGERILIIDDLLATGGTAKACVDMIQQLDGEVAALDFLIELTFLKGREKLPDLEVHAHIVI